MSFYFEPISSIDPTTLQRFASRCSAADSVPELDVGGWADITWSQYYYLSYILVWPQTEYRMERQNATVLVVNVLVATVLVLSAPERSQSTVRCSTRRTPLTRLGREPQTNKQRTLLLY